MLINKKHFFTRSRWIAFNSGRAGRRSRAAGAAFFMARLQKAILHQTSIHRASIQHTAVVTLVLATYLSAAAFAETKKEYRYTVGPNANISVDTQYGAISVKPGSSDEVLVTATLKSDNVEVDEQQNGNRKSGAILIRFVDARIERRVLETAGGRATAGGKGAGSEGGDGVVGTEGHEPVALFHGDPGGQMLPLEEFGKSGALRFGEEDRQLGLAIGGGEAGDDNLFAQVFASGAEFFEDGSGASGVAAPPGAQFGAFGHLLVEHFLGLAQIAGQVGDAGEEDGGRGQAAQQLAGIAKLRHADLGQAGAQAFQLLGELLAIAAPADIVLHGDGLQVGAGDGLIAGVEDLLVAV